MKRLLFGLFLWVGVASTVSSNAATGKGTFVYDVRDATSGELIPCKLTFVSNLYYIRLSKGDMGTGDKALPYLHQVYSTSCTGKVRLLPGEYDIYVSRGLEWELGKIKKQKITSGVTSEAKLKLEKVIDTTGWVSGDFHVHAGPSPDSLVSVDDRIRQLVADGLMYVGSADHNDVTDYAPNIKKLGLEETINSGPGEELSIGGWGHWGVFPLQRVEGAKGHGAVPFSGKTIDQIFEFIRKNHPDAVITVNHPRLDSGISYFNLGGFQTKTAKATKKGFRYDFDAMEILNGYRLSQPESIKRLIQDWFSLLNHGYLVTALGDSDSHYMVKNIGGYPRNYMAIEEEELPKVTPSMIAKSIKGRHVLVTTGPFVRMNVGAASLGDLVVAPTGEAQLTISVEAPLWISVSKVTLFINGEVSQTWSVTETSKVQRLQQKVDLKLTRDSFVVVQAEGDQTLWPVYGDNTTYKVYPFAITNPIFFDVDANGVFDPVISSQ